MNLPPELVNNVRMSSAERGSVWLTSLPETLQIVADRWGLSQIEPFSNLTFHFVARAMRGTTPVVLKLGSSPEDLAQESAALRAMAGRAVEVLESATEDGALLLSRADPGIPLEATWTPESDDDQTTILAKFVHPIQSDPSAPGAPRPSVEDWLSAIDQNSPPFAHEAVLIREKLLAHPYDRHFLHGDLHHGNVLSDGSGHILIDPKGVWGPPAFEVYALLHNPVQATADEACRLLGRRLEIVHRTTMIPIRELAEWGFVGLAMSAAWDMEGGTDPCPKTIAVAEQLWTGYIRP